MAQKSSEFNFDMNEFKEQMNQIKEAASKAKKEQDEKKARGEDTKQPLGQKIIGIIILIAFVVIVGIVLVSNLDMLFLPKNSITIVVSDNNGEAINGLRLDIRGPVIYDQEFSDINDITILDAEPGDYTLVFENIPEGYSCPKLIDNFTLKQDGKVKLEYECTKEN